MAEPFPLALADREYYVKGLGPRACLEVIGLVFFLFLLSFFYCPFFCPFLFLFYGFYSFLFSLTALIMIRWYRLIKFDWYKWLFERSVLRLRSLFRFERRKSMKYLKKTSAAGPLSGSSLSGGQSPTARCAGVHHAKRNQIGSK